MRNLETISSSVIVVCSTGSLSTFRIAWVSLTASSDPSHIRMRMGIITLKKCRVCLSILCNECADIGLRYCFTSAGIVCANEVFLPGNAQNTADGTFPSTIDSMHSSRCSLNWIEACWIIVGYYHSLHNKMFVWAYVRVWVCTISIPCFYQE